MNRGYRYLWVLVVSGLIDLAPAVGDALGRSLPEPPRILNPRSYGSPSGQYALLVDPGDRYGQFGASYRLTKQGREVWSGQRPFTLWEAVVTDDGVVGGYSYSLGWSGYAEGRSKAGHGDFHVILIDAEGHLRLDQVTKREGGRGIPNAPPNPLASGLVVDADNDRLLVRIQDADYDRNAEAWWVFRISTGKSLGVCRPKELMPDAELARSLCEVRPVAGTPLMLVRWSRSEEDQEVGDGARFTLVTPAGETVWSIDWPGDYHIPNDEAAEDRLWSELHKHGAILRCDQPGRFELWRARDAQRVGFSVGRGAAGRWLVTEGDRRPYVAPPKVEPPPAAIPDWRPHVSGRITLRVPGRRPAPPIRDLSDFVFDGRGRIAFIRREADQSHTFILVDQAGKVLRSLPLPMSRDRSDPTTLAWIADDRFLVVQGSPNDRATTVAEWIDAATGRLTPDDVFHGPIPPKIVGFPDGGFASLAWMGEEVAAFDARGARRWSLRADLSANAPATLYMPTDIAVTTESKIAVLDVYRSTVQLFDRDGKHERTIELGRAWKSQPNYPSEIAADRDGGFVVHDRHGSPRLFRMGADGTVRARVNPRYADGRRFRLDPGARVAPDGRLWTSDGHALLRLDGDGTVNRVLGEPPNIDRLDRAVAVALDASGRIYAVAGRTGTVHVFDPDGRWLRACEPDPGDVPEELYGPDLAVSDSGEVFLSVIGSDDRRHLHFSPEGKRLGFVAPPRDTFPQRWHVQPRTARRWVVCLEEILLVDRSGRVIRTIARRPDRNWLEWAGPASVAPDGSIAVVDAASVNLYTAQGDPVRTMHLPRSFKWSHPEIAYDGRHLVVAEEGLIVAFSVKGDVVGRLVPLPPGEHDGAWTPFLTRGGSELLLFNGRNTIYRFAMP